VIAKAGKLFLPDIFGLKSSDVPLIMVSKTAVESCSTHPEKLYNTGWVT
jgi:hypothetical protein